MEQLGLEWALIWDADIAGGGATCGFTMASVYLSSFGATLLVALAPNLGVIPSLLPLK